MLIPLLLGCATVFFSMVIQVWVVVVMVRYILRVLKRKNREQDKIGFETLVISEILLILFFGHLVQIAIWAQLFMVLDEFDHFKTAFYHSAVNFASLGYGDIVMSEQWRLLGAIEASNGVLMFGLSAGAMLSVMNAIFSHHWTDKPALPDKGD